MPLYYDSDYVLFILVKKDVMKERQLLHRLIADATMYRAVRDEVCGKHGTGDSGGLGAI